jgi:cytochrome c-type biogenesis protein CcmH
MGVRGIASGMAEQKRLNSTVVSWIVLLALSVVVILALVSSLSPPRGPQRLGETRLSITSDPDPPRIGLNRLQIHVSSREGQPLVGSTIEVKYGPEAGGLLTRTAAAAAAEGVHETDVHFDAPGPWQVTLTLRREGSSDLSTTYLYNVAPAADGGRTLAGTIRIAPSLAKGIGPGDALFVIARKGPGPPLAAKRIANPTFPVSFHLGPDDMVMARGAFQGEVFVSARVSRGGVAGPARPGDLEGSYPALVKIGGQPIEILIDREL